MHCKHSIKTALWSLVVAACLTQPAALAQHAGEQTGGHIGEPLVVKDARYGEILFYFYQEEYFPAIVRLQAAKERSQLENHDAEAELLLGGLYLSYGHHLRAAEIFERLLAGNTTPAIRDRTWFFLAKIWYQRGYLDESLKALANIEGALDDAMDAEKRMLRAQVLIDSGAYDEAIADLAGWEGESGWESYAKFNLGVAMVRSGRVDEAASLLDAVGNIRPDSEELSALRDKANLALGYAYLQGDQPVAAKPLLQRVRLEGPFSNKALLGVGWADAETADYRQALVPWMELRSRDLLDSAVQESMLAIPYAMARLDSIGQAADYYVSAIDAFHEESRRIDQVIARIEQGALVDSFVAEDRNAATGWYWKLDALPEGTESRYLYHLLATHKFQEGLKNFRDLRYLSKNLAGWQESVGVFRSMLDTRELAYTERLPGTTSRLAAADIESLVDQKLEFDARLNIIEENGDSLALATEREFDMWGEITALERSPAFASNTPEAAEARKKVALLKGVLQWDLDRQFNDRLWHIRRRLRQAGEGLVETQRARRGVDAAMREEPAQFAGFGDRIEAIGPRIDSLQRRVDKAVRQHRIFLQDVAVEELQAQKQRL
ncbi:MAG TPA: tetratricopeptide repeat protein, partial [Woeseiaceae bacterium]|nr:tetratricopeptide repeat protein [Woeseiaceae bacterium]